MTLFSTNPDERVFYYSERPENKLYPQSESFYFKVAEITKDYCIVKRFEFIDDGIDFKVIKFLKPYVKSIQDAVDFVERTTR